MKFPLNSVYSRGQIACHARAARNHTFVSERPFHFGTAFQGETPFQLERGGSAVERGREEVSARGSMNSRLSRLARALLSREAVRRTLNGKEVTQMIRKIGFLLALVTLLAAGAASAAPPDEVNAPRTQDSLQAP
jgi:hypothetical protein